MNTLKEAILIEFAKEIIIYKQYKNSSLSDDDNFLENISIICDALENKKDINEVYSNESKRAIFDKGIPCKSSKMIWFVCAHEDNIELFKWACNGLGWLKGSEKNRAILPLQDYVKEYKPEQIIHWLLDKNHENKDIPYVARTISPYLLYAVEGREKKLQHQLVSRGILTTNSQDTYDFLKQTQDEHLFNKVMKKHFKTFHFYLDNVILKQSNADREIKFFSHYFDNLDASEKIETFRTMKFDNIADYISSYHLNKNLEESLSLKNSTKKKIKI